MPAANHPPHPHPAASYSITLARVQHFRVYETLYTPKPAVAPFSTSGNVSDLSKGTALPAGGAERSGFE